MSVQDVLERKGYYDELVNVFETIRAKRAFLEKSMREEYEERTDVERDVAALKAKLIALHKAMRETQRTKMVNDTFLTELQAGGVRAFIALRKLKFASVPIAERARQVRDEFREGVLEERPDSPHAARKLGSSSENNHMSLQVKELSFLGSDDNQVPVRCYFGGGGDASAAPALVFFHGEGYVIGDLETHDWLCRSLAALSRVTVVAVDYRRAPEAKFPAAFVDAYQAVCWVAQGGLGGRPPRALGVAGDSNGGALAIACCVQARDRDDGPEISVQLLFYPWMDLRPESPAMLQAETNDQAAFLADLDWSRSVYAPPFPEPELREVDVEEAGAPAVADLHPLGADGRPWFEDPRASPLLTESLADLPVAFIAYAADDPVACESVRLAERLREECGHDGVHTLHMQGPLGHGFVKNSDQPQAHACVAAAAAFLSMAVRGPASPSRKKA